jgi:hypothetical protein
MAGPAPNQLIDLLHALRRRRYQVIVPAVLIASLGIAFAFIVPKRYKLSTRIAVRESVRAEPDYRLRNPQDTALRREVPSVEDHIVNFQRVKDVLDRNLQQWPEYRQAGSGFARDQFIRDRILDNLEALLRSKDPKGGTIFIDVTFSDEDRERAARFLGDLTETYCALDSNGHCSSRGNPTPAGNVWHGGSIDFSKQQQRLITWVQLVERAKESLGFS